MRRSRRALRTALGIAVIVAAARCAMETPAAGPAAEVRPTPPSAGKIPITTASADAKSEFLQGREKAEKLQVTDSIQHFQKAASLDPNFASAELNLAISAPTGKEFFEHLDRAVALADKASD